MFDIDVVYAVASQLGRGGVGAIAYHAVEGLSSHGCLKRSVSLAGISVRESVMLPFFPKPPFLPSRIYYDLKNLYFDHATAAFFAGPCDIFHGWNSQALASVRAAKKLGATTIVERASTHPLYQYALLRKEYARYGCEPQRYTERSIRELKECDFITVPPNPVVTQSFLENGITEEKLIEIPFGVDTEKFSPARRNEGAFRALFVGTLSLRKGILYLLKAWRELEKEGIDGELLVVGPVEPLIRSHIQKLAAKNVRMVRWSDGVEHYYAAADVFVLPSLEEGSSLATYEAMACGLPLVTTPNAGSVARNGKDGFLIPARSVSQIQEKIRYLYQNPQETRRMGRSARKRVENYTWKNYQKSLYAAYEGILSR